MMTPLPLAKPAAFTTSGSLRRFHKGQCGFHAGKGPAFRGGDGGIAHHFFGEGFVGFEFGAGARGPKRFDLLFLQGIDEAQGQGVFRADHDQIRRHILHRLHRAGISLALIGSNSPRRMPGFPGAMNKRLHSGDCLIFHAKACSRRRSR